MIIHNVKVGVTVSAFDTESQQTIAAQTSNMDSYDTDRDVAIKQAKDLIEDVLDAMGEMPAPVPPPDFGRVLVPAAGKLKH